MPASGMRLGALVTTPQYLARYWLLGSSIDTGGIAVRMGLDYATVTKSPKSNVILVAKNHRGLLISY